MDIIALKNYKEKILKKRKLKHNYNIPNTDKTEEVVLDIENMIMYITRMIINLGYDYSQLMVTFDIHSLKHNYLTKKDSSPDFVCFGMHNTIVKDGIPINTSLFSDIEHFPITNKYIDKIKFETLMNNLGYSVSVNEYEKTMSIGVDLSKCQEYEQNKVKDKRL